MIEQDYRSTVEVTEALIRLLVKANAYNPENQFVTIDKVWENPSLNMAFSEHLAHLLSTIIPVERLSGIITMDNVLYPFGPLPIATFLSYKLDVPLGIWKENDDPITGNHRLYGVVPEHGAMVLYDVARFGLTAIRMLDSLHEKNIEPGWFVAIVDCEKTAKDTILREVSKYMHYELDFLSLIKLSQIEELVQEGARGG